MTVLTYLDKVCHRNLQNFNSSEAVVLQYVDDILLCAETEEACLQASEDFLNFLAGCGYKASREKAQLCQQSVKYLGLIISEGTRAIGPERIKVKVKVKSLFSTPGTGEPGGLPSVGSHRVGHN